MINDIILNYHNKLESYKQDNSIENKDNLVQSIISLDEEENNKYLSELNKYAYNSTTIKEEQERLNNILTLISKREEERDILIKQINELSLDVVLQDIPNLDKLIIFSNKLKVINTYFDIISKLNKNNKDKAIEIFKRKEFRIILLEYSLILNDSDEEIEKYINSLLDTNVSSDKLKILKSYYDLEKKFPNLSIPNMGLVDDNNCIKLDNSKFFIN